MGNLGWSYEWVVYCRVTLYSHPHGFYPIHGFYSIIPSSDKAITGIRDLYANANIFPLYYYLIFLTTFTNAVT